MKKKENISKTATIIGQEGASFLHTTLYLTHYNTQKINFRL